MFEDEVLKSEVPVLVDFYGVHCGPCRRMMPILNQLSSEGFKVVKIDAHDNMELSQSLGISSLPTFLVFKNGQEVKRMVGTVSINDLKNAML